MEEIPPSPHSMDADALQKLIHLLKATDDPLIQEQALITLSNSAAFSVNQVSVVQWKTSAFHYQSVWKMKGTVLLKSVTRLRAGLTCVLNLVSYVYALISC